MAIGNTMPYVYGAYLMNPHLKSTYNTVNKNSFGRLINGYYGKHSLFKKTLESTDASGLLEVNDQAKELQTSLKRLSSQEEFYTEGETEELEEAIKSFVDDYNSLKESFQMTGNEEFQKKGSRIDAIVKAHKEKLSAIGILSNEDGILTIRENGFEDMELEEVKGLFTGEDSFASRIMKKAGTLGKEALSLLAPSPKFYGQSGSIQYVIHAGTLFSTCC